MSTSWQTTSAASGKRDLFNNEYFTCKSPTVTTMRSGRGASRNIHVFDKKITQACITYVHVRDIV